MKKRIFACILTAGCLCLSACGGETTAQTTTTAKIETQAIEFTASEVTAVVIAEVPINSAVEKTKDDINDYFVGMDAEKVVEASFYLCGSSAYPDEVGVIEFVSEDDAVKGAESVTDRIGRQQETYSSYAPDEMYKFGSNASAYVSGNYVYYIVTSDNDKAKEIIERYIP